MLGLKARTAQETKQTSDVDLDQVEAGPVVPAFSESVIQPKRRRSWKKQISFHLDQTGLQMSVGQQRGKVCRLIDAKKMYIPSDAVTDQARDKFIARSIGEYLHKHGGHNAEVTVTISGTETAFRTFNMPDMKAAELARAVTFEAKRQVPFPLQDCIFDFRPIYRIKTPDRSALKVALHAATRTAIDERLAPFQKSKVTVNRVYHAHDLIGQLLKSLPDYAEDQIYTLINVERTRTEISYYKGSNLEFYHICSVGSSFLARRSDPTVFEYFAESLAGEIQNSLDYYTGQYSGQFTTRIYIYGDLAYTDELIDLLHDRFGYEFKRFPTEDLRVTASGGKDQLDSLSVCLPVLAAATCPAQLANLLPCEIKTTIAQRSQQRLMVTGMIALVGLLLATWVSARMQVATLDNRLQGLTTQVENFKASSLFDMNSTLTSEVVAGQTYLEKIRPTPTYLALTLKELSNLTPQSITLSALHYMADEPDRNFSLDGTVRSAEIPPEVILAEYVEALRSSPFVSDVTVDQYTKRVTDAASDLDFHVSMRAKR